MTLERREYALRRPLLRRAARALDHVLDRWPRRAGPPVPEAPRRILFVRLDHLGDVLFATPALRAIRDGFPGAHVTVLCGPWACGAVRGTGLADAVHAVAVPWFARGARCDRGAFGRVLAWMRRQRFDLAFEPRGDARHLVWLWAARIPVRIGSGATGCGALLTHEVVPRATHEVERNLDVVRVALPGARAGPLVPVPAAPAAAARALLDAGSVPWGARVCLVHAGAGAPTKRWPPARLGRCVDRLVEAGFAVVFCGTEADRAATEAARACARQPTASLVGRTSLAEFAALCESASAFLGHDSGPTHVAVAAGTPVVVVHGGPSDPARWGAWGGRTRLLRHAVACSPCGLRRCPYAHECMEEIDPASVASAVLDVARGAA